jgi:hypothetical protein
MKIIVAEVSKTWPNTKNETVAQLFDQVINFNLSRGYTLKDWKLSRLLYKKG